jgi:hypothetical protein
MILQKIKDLVPELTIAELDSLEYYVRARKEDKVRVKILRDSISNKRG